MPRTILSAFIVLWAVGAAGCGLVGACGDPCPAGYYRDSFCGCSPKSVEKNKQTDSPTADSVAPHWICNARNSDEYIAWQPDSGWGDTGFLGWVGKTVRFASHRCDLSAIPFLRQQGDCALDHKNDPYCVTPGRNSVLDITAVLRHQNNLNGAVAWGFRGKLRTLSAGMMTPGEEATEIAVGASGPNGQEDGNGLHSSLLHWAMAPAEGEAVFGEAIDCQSACRRQNEYCAVATVNRLDEKLWESFLTQLRDKRSRIAKSDLMSAVFESDDACVRSDISVSADGVLRNSGQGDCRVTIPFSGGTTVSLDLPSTVSGRLAVEASLVSVVFLAPEEKPEITFSDEDYQRDFGGSVDAVSLSGRDLTVRTNTGRCVQLRR